jgi:hypothetical protein
VRLHGDLQLLNSHSNLKHNNNNLHNRNLNSLNRRLNPSSRSNNTNNTNNHRLHLSDLGLDLACDLDHIIIPARRLEVRCGAVRVWVLVVLASELGLEVVGSLGLVLRIRRSGIRLLRITLFLRRRRARSCMDHRPHRTMGRE